MVLRLEIVKSFDNYWLKVVKDAKKAPQLSSLLSSLLKIVSIYVIIDISSFQMIVKIVIASLSDWLQNLTPVFQPMRGKSKTNRSLYAHFFSFLSKSLLNCLEY